jgi:hypothetical protein
MFGLLIKRTKNFGNFNMARYFPIFINFLVMSCNGNDLLFLTNLKSLRVSLSSSFFFLPLRGRFSMSPRSRYLFTTAYTVALFSWRFLPISKYDFPAS